MIIQGSILEDRTPEPAFGEGVPNYMLSNPPLTTPTTAKFACFLNTLAIDSTQVYAFCLCGIRVFVVTYHSIRLHLNSIVSHFVRRRSS
jgi:hypothetical protein